MNRKGSGQPLQAPFELFERGLYLALQQAGMRSSRVHTPQGTLHLLRSEGQGHGPDLVFLHGLSANAPELSRVYLPLRRRAGRILALDLPGHGLSEAPAEGMLGGPMFAMLSAALDKLLDPARPAVLVGNSLGGLCAIRYALHAPERVAGLFLSSPGGAAMPEESFRPFVERFRNQQLPATRDFVSDLFGHALPGPLHWLCTEMARFRFGKPPIQAMLDQLATADLLSADELGRLQAPAWIVWGQSDFIQPGQLDFFKAHAPAQIRILEPPGFSHCPFLEFPGPFRVLLEDFLASLQDQPKAARRIVLEV